MTDIQEQDTEEYDPTQVEYAESERPYQEVLTPNQMNRFLAYQENDKLIEEGVKDEEEGALKQIRGAHKIWKHKLWKEATSEITGARFKSQEQWIQECIDSHHIHVFGRTNFFEIVTAVEKGIGLSLDYEEALRLGLNYTAIEALEQSGAMKFVLTKEHGKTAFAPTVTELGNDKLLKGGLKTPTEYVRDLSSMKPRDALRTVNHDVGKIYTYCDTIVPYAGDTPFMNEQGAMVFAVQFTLVNPTNGNTPYACKIMFEADADKKVVEGALRMLKGDFRL